MRLIMTNNMFGIEMFVAYSDGLLLRCLPGDSRRAILFVAFGDVI